MEIISILEKAKDNLLSFLLGCSTAAAGAYIVMDKVHSKEVEIIRLDSEVKTTTMKAEMDVLKRQVSDLEKENLLLTQKDSYKKSLSGIEELIARIDEEIGQKKARIRMAASSGISFASEDGNKTPEKSDYYIELERELNVLQDQRHAAREKQIELLVSTKMNTTTWRSTAAVGRGGCGRHYFTDVPMM